MDPQPTPSDFLNAETVIDFLVQNLAHDAKLNMETWDRETMQKHVNKRAALIATKGMLLDEVERLLAAQG